MIPFLLTIGYLMLNDSLGYPYYRLINVGWYLPSPYYRLINVLWLPFLKIKKFRVPSLKIRKFRVISCSCFLIDMKFISKLLSCLVMENVAFFNPHLHKTYFSNIYIYIFIFTICSKNMFFENPKKIKQKVGLPFKKTKIFKLSDSQISKNNMFWKMNPYFSCIRWAILVIVRRSPGPDFDQIFEVPEIIQKVLEYDRGP